MISTTGLLDFQENSSLVRTLFDKDFNLKDFDSDELKIPKRFKDFSFSPGKKGFNLTKIAGELKNYLASVGISSSEFSLIVPGVCEAMKNAYEHGNKRDNSKKIYWNQNFSKDKELEIFVGDEGGTIDGNLFSYALLFKEIKCAEKREEISDFYAFCGKEFAPLGHSGVGTKVMNKCFDTVKYLKNSEGGLRVYLQKKI